MKLGLCSVAGCIGSAIAFLFGGWDSSIVTLLLFMLIDYASGLIVAGVFKKSTKTATGGLDSYTCYKGLVKKGMILVFVFIGVRLDIEMGSNYIRDAVCIAFMVNELISIVENAGLMGVKIPKVITEAIDLLNGREEQHD